MSFREHAADGPTGTGTTGTEPTGIGPASTGPTGTGPSQTTGSIDAARASAANWVVCSARNAAYGRMYFGVQGIAGAVWWISVCVFPAVREATLGEIDPVLMGMADVPLFVIMSFVAALGGRRWASLVVTSWTLLVTIGMVVYATVSEIAGWGALLMVAASVGSVLAALLVWCERIPADRLLRGPLGFASAVPSPIRANLVRTLLQLAVFWVVFLALIPAAIVWIEARWGIGVGLPFAVRVAGAVVLMLASAPGLWSAFAIALHGAGTPLPSTATNRLVIVGPYAYLRNPMAVAGIAQAVGVGMLTGSWVVIAYAVCGAIYWNELVRPFEEADLRAKFGEPYADYCARVSCWWPRRRRFGDGAPFRRRV